MSLIRTLYQDHVTRPTKSHYSETPRPWGPDKRMHDVTCLCKPQRNFEYFEIRISNSEWQLCNINYKTFHSRFDQITLAVKRGWNIKTSSTFGMQPYWYSKFPSAYSSILLSSLQRPESGRYRRLTKSGTPWSSGPELAVIETKAIIS